MERINRRDFLKKAGKTALACGAIVGLGSSLLKRIPFTANSAYAGKPKPEFELYNSINPNVKDSQINTFKDCLEKGYKPGLYYKTSEPVFSMASGTVAEVRPIESLADWVRDFGDDPDKAKGFSVQIVYGVQYRVFYFHLQHPQVEFGQKVDRKTLIGYPDDRWSYLGLMLLEARDAADPDNYGVNHHLMEYWDGRTDFEIPRDEQEMRVEKQTQLMYECADYYKGPEEYNLLRKKHHSGGKVFKCSIIEKFRYLEYLYYNDPKLFPSLEEEQFRLMRKEFYNNQPIILTLPFSQV